MNWFDIYVGSAMLCQLAATVLWLCLYRSVKPFFWWTIGIAMCLVVLHCAGYWTNALWLSQATALSNSVLMVLIVIAARQGIRRAEKLEDQVVVEHQMATTEHAAAEQLATLLNDYKTRIDYYESQADAHKLPKLP